MGNTNLKYGIGSNVKLKSGEIVVLQGFEIGVFGEIFYKIGPNTYTPESNIEMMIAYGWNDKGKSLGLESLNQKGEEGRRMKVGDKIRIKNSYSLASNTKKGEIYTIGKIDYDSIYTTEGWVVLKSDVELFTKQEPTLVEKAKSLLNDKNIDWKNWSQLRKSLESIIKEETKMEVKKSKWYKPWTWFSKPKNEELVVGPGNLGELKNESYTNIYMDEVDTYTPPRNIPKPRNDSHELALKPKAKKKQSAKKAAKKKALKKKAGKK